MTLSMNKYFIRARPHQRKKVIDEDYAGIVVSDQCPSYNWIAADRHQLCWAHVKRNLQQMADYSGGGHTAYIGKHLCLLTNVIFHTRHRYEQDELNYPLVLTANAQAAKIVRSLVEQRDMSWSSGIGGDASYCSNIERACGFSSRKRQSP